MQAASIRYLGSLLAGALDAFGFLIELVVTFGFGGCGLAAFFLSLVVVPAAMVERDLTLMLVGVAMFLVTVPYYYYFRVAAFILLKFGRRGCGNASFRSVLCNNSHYTQFYLLHRRLRRLAAEYGYALSDDEIARASSLARRHRIATWLSLTTFGGIILVTAVLAAVGVVQSSG